MLTKVKMPLSDMMVSSHPHITFVCVCVCMGASLCVICRGRHDSLWDRFFLIGNENFFIEISEIVTWRLMWNYFNSVFVWGRDQRQTHISMRCTRWNFKNDIYIYRKDLRFFYNCTYWKHFYRAKCQSFVKELELLSFLKAYG